MGFHGYGHTSCIIGEFSIADYPEGPQIHRCSLDSASHSQEFHRRHPHRTIVPRHRNDGPVDLSQYCTPTGRGTWSIGGQRSSTHLPSLLHTHNALNGQVTRNPSKVTGAFGYAQQTIYNHDTFQKVEASFKQSRLVYLPLSVNMPNIILKSEDAKNHRSQNIIGKVEQERNSAMLFNAVRTATFPFSICHEQSHLCADVANMIDVQKAVAISTITLRIASERRNSIYGLETGRGHSMRFRPQLAGNEQYFKHKKYLNGGFMGSKGRHRQFIFEDLELLL